MNIFFYWEPVFQHRGGSELHLSAIQTTARGLLISATHLLTIDPPKKFLMFCATDGEAALSQAPGELVRGCKFHFWNGFQDETNI